jgi:hypothetical protein
MRSGASLLSVSVFASDLTELSGESRLRPVPMTGPQRPRYSAGGVSERAAEWSEWPVFRAELEPNGTRDASGTHSDASASRRGGLVLISPED